MKRVAEFYFWDSLEELPEDFSPSLCCPGCISLKTVFISLGLYQVGFDTKFNFTVIFVLPLQDMCALGTADKSCYR